MARTVASRAPDGLEKPDDVDKSRAGRSAADLTCLERQVGGLAGILAHVAVSAVIAASCPRTCSSTTALSVRSAHSAPSTGKAAQRSAA